MWGLVAFLLLAALALWLFGQLLVFLGTGLGVLVDWVKSITPAGRAAAQRHRDYMEWRRANPEEAARQDFHDEWDDRAWHAGVVGVLGTQEEQLDVRTLTAHLSHRLY